MGKLQSAEHPGHRERSARLRRPASCRRRSQPLDAIGPQVNPIASRGHARLKGQFYVGASDKWIREMSQDLRDGSARHRVARVVIQRVRQGIVAAIRHKTRRRN